MAKPPESHPSSDIEGVNRDGTRPSKPLPADGADAGDLADAKDQSVARPDYDGATSEDDRTG